jgi:hypothetical protein
MISMESASMSNLGASLSSSDVMLASGEAMEGGACPAGGGAVDVNRLWTAPYLQLRVATR